MKHRKKGMETLQETLKTKVGDHDDLILVPRSLLVAIDSELSAIAHGRPPQDAAELYPKVRKLYEVQKPELPLKDKMKDITSEELLAVAASCHNQRAFAPASSGKALEEAEKALTRAADYIGKLERKSE